MVEMKRAARTDEKMRADHAKNFLECIKTRQAPVENLDLGHHVSTVSHLGNLALRSKNRIDWDAAAERVTNNEAANALVTRDYRAPWKLV
jgi:hypothetical protein